MRLLNHGGFLVEHLNDLTEESKIPGANNLEAKSPEAGKSLKAKIQIFQ